MTKEDDDYIFRGVINKTDPESRKKLEQASQSLVGKNLKDAPSNISGDSGAFGRFVEKIFQDAGVWVDTSTSGPDFVEYQVELKTRKSTATSAFTIGSMSVQDIVDTEWKDCRLSEKTRAVLLLTWDARTKQIIDATLWDFTDESCQAVFAVGYEHGRQVIKNHLEEGLRIPKYIRKGQKQDSNQKSKKKAVHPVYLEVSGDSVRLRVAKVGVSALQCNAEVVGLSNGFFDWSEVSHIAAAS